MIEAIILAAGTSSRMGKDNKLLLPVNNKPMITHVVDHLSKTQINNLIVVTGHEDSLVKAALENRTIEFTHNPNFITGMTGSIQTGVKQLSPKCDGFLVCLSDMPFLLANDYQILIDAFYQAKTKIEHPIVIPVKDGRKGNPVLFDQHFKSDILAHKKPEGCRDILINNSKNLIKAPVQSDAFFKDIDTPEVYKNL